MNLFCDDKVFFSVGLQSISFKRQLQFASTGGTERRLPHEPPNLT